MNFFNLNLFLFYNGYKLGRMPLFIWPLIQTYNLSTTENILVTINFSRERERGGERDGGRRV